MRLRDLASRLLSSPFAMVVLPRGCAGCGEPDSVLCTDCRALFTVWPSRQLPGLPGGTLACARYSGRARSAVLAWKDHDDRECDTVFARYLAFAVDMMLGRIGADSGVSGVSSVGSGHRVMLVPVPSSGRSVRARGRPHMTVLSLAVCRLLCGEYGYDAVVADVLMVARHGGRSVSLSSAQQRHDRMGDRFRVRGRLHDGCLHDMGCRDAGVGTVILLDDIITTGSTLRGCADVLAAAGIHVSAAIALADTPPRGGSLRAG